MKRRGFLFLNFPVGNSFGIKGLSCELEDYDHACFRFGRLLRNWLVVKD